MLKIASFIQGNTGIFGDIRRLRFVLAGFALHLASQFRQLDRKLQILHAGCGLAGGMSGLA